MQALRRQLGSLDNLIAFEAAARLGNFSRAAEELSVAQPAISRRIRQLETYLGVDLFTRRGTRVTCTQAGREFYRAVSDALAIVQTSADRLRQDDSQVVRLRVNVAAASLWLMPALSGFYDAHPDITLHLVCIDEMPELASSPFDMEIRFGDTPWPDVDCFPLLGEEIYPVAAPALLAQLGGPEAACSHTAPLLQSSNFISPLMDWRSWRDIPPEQVLRYLTTYAMVLESAVRGHGVALGWHYYVAPLIARGDLVRLPGLSRSLGFQEYLTIRRTAAQRPAVQKTRDWLLQLASETREALALPEAE